MGPIDLQTNPAILLIWNAQLEKTYLSYTHMFLNLCSESYYGEKIQVKAIFLTCLAHPGGDCRSTRASFYWGTEISGWTCWVEGKGSAYDDSTNLHLALLGSQDEVHCHYNVILFSLLVVMDLVPLKPHKLLKNRGNLEFNAICHNFEKCRGGNSHPIFIYIAYLVCEEGKMCFGEWK